MRHASRFRLVTHALAGVGALWGLFAAGALIAARPAPGIVVALLLAVTLFLLFRWRSIPDCGTANTRRSMLAMLAEVALLYLYYALAVIGFIGLYGGIVAVIASR